MSLTEHSFSVGQRFRYGRLPRSLRIIAENAQRKGYPEDAQNILSRIRAPVRLTTVLLPEILAEASVTTPGPGP